MPKLLTEIILYILFNAAKLANFCDIPAKCRIFWGSILGFKTHITTVPKPDL